MSTYAVKENYLEESVARSYDRQRFENRAGRWFDRLEKRAIRNMVKQVLDECPNPTVLDVPCGTGRITETLLDMGLRVTGADISERMIEVGLERCRRFANRASFQILDLDAPDLPQAAFDLVTCIRLMHHLDSRDREGVFRSLARMTRYYVLVNVSFSSPYYRLRRRVKRRLGQGVSRASSTWRQIQDETRCAGLRLAGHRFAGRFLSEDLILLLKKELL